MASVRETILSVGSIGIREALVGFLSEFVRVPSPNPPGDTRAGAAFLHDQLKAHGVPVSYRTAKPEMPNLVGTFSGRGTARTSSSTDTSTCFPPARPRLGHAIPGAAPSRAAGCTAAASST